MRYFRCLFTMKQSLICFIQCFVIAVLTFSQATLFSQNTIMCSYVGKIDESYDEILNTLNTRVVAGDSLSYTVSEGRAMQNDTSKIILPDSCTLVLLFDIQYAFISKPNLNYLLLVEKIGEFADNKTRYYISEVVEELILTPSFINFLVDNEELKHVTSQFFYILENSQRDSEVVFKLKKWLRQNVAKKDLDFYKRTNSLLEAKK